MSDRELNRGGLRIVTTLDPQRQRLAVDAARGPLDGRSGNLRSAMVAIDPDTGGVLAYYGGDGGHGPGLRPRTAAGRADVHPLRRCWPGCCTIRRWIPVQPIGMLARRVGSGAVADAARAAGIIPSTDHDVRRDQAHGDTAVSPYDLASAYATLAAGGVWRPPHLVAEVQDRGRPGALPRGTAGRAAVRPERGPSGHRDDGAVRRPDRVGPARWPLGRGPGRRGRPRPAGTTRGRPGSPRTWPPRCGWGPTRRHRRPSTAVRRNRVCAGRARSRPRHGRPDPGRPVPGRPGPRHRVPRGRRCCPGGCGGSS